MVFKIQTEEGWVYFDKIQKFEISRILYRMVLSEYEKDHARGPYPEFSILGDAKTRVCPSDVYIVPHVFLEGKPQQNDGSWFRCYAARWRDADGIKTVTFNGTGYLLNDSGKTVECYCSN